MPWISFSLSGKQIKLSNMKFEEITFASLGLKSLGPIPRQPKAAALKKFQPDPKIMIRISAPAQYRQSFLEKNEWDSAKTVLLQVAQWKTCPVSTISGGTWQWQQVQKHHTLVGHLRVPEKVALALESHSGQKGIFITRTGVDKRNEKVKWMPRPHEYDADNYLRSCLAEAKKREQSLKFRMGGGSDLGVLRLPTDTVPQRPTQIQVQGFPRSWDAPDVTNFLNEQGWQEVVPVTCRSVNGIMLMRMTRNFRSMSLNHKASFPNPSRSLLLLRLEKSSGINLPLRFSMPT